jgi:hypothetical protein
MDFDIFQEKENLFYFHLLSEDIFMNNNKVSVIRDREGHAQLALPSRLWRIEVRYM